MYEFHILELRNEEINANGWKSSQLRKECPDLCDAGAALKPIELTSQLVN